MRERETKREKETKRERGDGNKYLNKFIQILDYIFFAPLLIFKKCLHNQY